MIWYYAVDDYYYERPDEVTREEVLVVPDEDEIKQYIRERKEFSVLAPYMPPSHLAELFTVKELPNKFGIFTTAEQAYFETLPPEQRKMEEEKVLEKKTGLRIIKPNIDPNNMIGMANIKRYTLEIKANTDPKLQPKGVFLAGLPGTGKSFSAKVVASELGYWLVELNLAKVMESGNPVFLLHAIFKHLERLSAQGQKFILWIDEIEKMFAGGNENEKRILGQLLTIMNDLNTAEGYKVHGIFWVTANNIRDILMRNPEFLRRGRFDQVFFVDAPRRENAKKIFTLYAKIYGLTRYVSRSKQGFEEDAVDLTREIYNDQSIGSPDASRFAYVPAEIEAIVKDLKRREAVNKRFLEATPEEKLEIITWLYTKHTRDKLLTKIIQKEIKNITSIDKEEEQLQKLAKLHEEKLKSGNALVSYLDLAAVLTTIEPLALSMKDAISVIRSNERFFTPVD